MGMDLNFFYLGERGFRLPPAKLREDGIKNVIALVDKGGVEVKNSGQKTLTHFRFMT